MIGVSAQGELHLGLLQNGVNAAQPVRLCIGHRCKALERSVEVGQGFGISPAPLRLLSSEDGVIDGLLVLCTASEVVGQKIEHLLSAASEQLLESQAYSRVGGTTA